MFLKQEKYLELISNSLMLPIQLFFVREAFCELFINQPFSQFSRISLRETDTGGKIISFSLDTPTITHIIILIAIVFCFYSNIMIFITKMFFPMQDTKTSWYIQLSGIAICFFSFTYYFYDFVNSAFSGIG